MGVGYFMGASGGVKSAAGVLRCKGRKRGKDEEISINGGKGT